MTKRDVSVAAGVAAPSGYALSSDDAVRSHDSAPSGGAHVRCVDCEYSLRGLPREGRCPECGAALARSWEWHEAALASGEPPLWMSSPAWLRRMGAGCALVSGSALGHMGLSFLSSKNPQPVGASMVAAAVSLYITTCLVLVVGLWLLGSREPATAKSLRDHTIIRAGAVIEILRVVRSFAWNPPVFDWHWYIAIVTTVLAAVVTAMLWRRLARLARRAGAAKTSRLAALLAWVLPALMIVQVVFFKYLPMSRYGSVLIAPQPVTGEATALVILPAGLIAGGSIGIRLAFWIPAMLTALAALSMLAAMTLIFFRTSMQSSASRQRPPEERQPVIGHDAGDVGVRETGGR